MARNNGHDVSSSLTDLMAGVAAIFLLIAVIFILMASKREEHEGKERRKFESQIEELRRFRQSVLESLDALRDSLQADHELQELVTMDEAARKRDPFLFVIVFNRNRLSFPRGTCSLGKDQEGIVSFAAPRVLGHVCRFAQTMQTNSGKAARASISMTLEGHTDQHSFLPPYAGCGVDRVGCMGGATSPACEQLGFENNVRLSGARAQSVFFAMQRAVVGDASLSECLERYFVVAGRGPVDPMDGRPWREAHDELQDEQNRRVVLKIRAQPSMDAIAAGSADEQMP